MSRHLRLFHSADWHFGKMIGNVDRTADFEAFIDTFIDLVNEREPDILLIAGDIFDTSLPSNSAQKLYYSWIHRLQSTSVKAIVITAGNHDSQRFLEAPKALLETMNCFIAGETPEEQVFIYRDKEGNPLVAIGAVPYLREADVRRGAMDYSDATRAELFEAGVKAHYDAVWQGIDEALGGRKVPRIGMGHLFVIGSEVRPGVQRAKDEGALNVGSLNSVTTAAFSQGWDYVALGHIHHAQTLTAETPMRYAGAPIGLTFNHRLYQHSLVEIDIDEAGALSLNTIAIPQPRHFVHLTGTVQELLDGIAKAGVDYREPYVEAILTSDEVEPLLSDKLTAAALAANVILIATRNERARQRYQEEEASLVELNELSPQEVFRLFVMEGKGDADKKASAASTESATTSTETAEPTLAGLELTDEKGPTAEKTSATEEETSEVGMSEERFARYQALLAEAVTGVQTNHWPLNAGSQE